MLIPKSTRLRYITAPDPSSLQTAVEALPFRIEIKEISEGKGYVRIYFVLPDEENLIWQSVDLT